MNNILMVADSAFELIMSIHIRLSVYKEDHVSIIITDRTSDAYSVYENLCKLKVFDKVIYVEASKFLDIKIINYMPKRIKGKISDILYIRKARRILNGFKTNIFLTSEIDYFSRYIYLALPNHTKFYLISEGIFGYAGLKENILLNMKLSISEANFLSSLYGIYFYGEKMGELPTQNPIQIPSINTDREYLIEILNSIYGYKPHDTVYQNKIIIFEESYSNDGGCDNLLDVVEKIVMKYGNEKVIVKRHPRDVDNRFDKMAIKTIEPYATPWELFTLNGDYKHCILLAANSASVYLNKIWDWGTEENACVMLNHIMNYQYASAEVIDVYMDFLEKIYEKAKIPTPNNWTELIDIIDKIFKEWS